MKPFLSIFQKIILLLSVVTMGSYTMTAEAAAGGSGVKTVRVWFRDKWGNVNPSPYSDTILIDHLP